MRLSSRLRLYDALWLAVLVAGLIALLVPPLIALIHPGPISLAW